MYYKFQPELDGTFRWFTFTLTADINVLSHTSSFSIMLNGVYLLYFVSQIKTKTCLVLTFIYASRYVEDSTASQKLYTIKTIGEENPHSISISIQGYFR